MKGRYGQYFGNTILPLLQKPHRGDIMFILFICHNNEKHMNLQWECRPSGASIHQQSTFHHNVVPMGLFKTIFTLLYQNAALLGLPKSHLHEACCKQFPFYSTDPKIIVTPPVAKLDKSAAMAFPSGEFKACCISVGFSKYNSAIR